MRFCRTARAAIFLAALAIPLNVKPEPYIIQLSFLGDVMLGRGIAEAAARNPEWQPFFALEPLTSRADILAANLESPLTSLPSVTQGFDLCAPSAMAAVLDSTGFDVLTQANNHILDCGEDGKQDTRENLTSRNILTIINQQEPVLVKKHGKTFAFLALDDVSSPIQLNTAVTLVQSAASQADEVIVSIHWGGEYQPVPSNRQKTLANNLVQSGADVIIGHHPHVIQPEEEIRRASDGKLCLVFYSLGNALFDQHALPDTREGSAVTLYLNSDNKLIYTIQHFTIDPRAGEIVSLNP